MKTSDLKKFAILFFAGLLCFYAHSQTFQVTTTADSGPGSLRDAMTNAIANGGGTIVFTKVSGTISLQSNLPSISGTLTILGNGPEHVTINGNQTYRIFNVLGGATCNVSGLAMQGGYALTNDPPTTSRAAIVNGGSLSMSNCFLHDNVANPVYPYGGGALSGSSVVLNNVIFSNHFGNLPSALSASNVRATNCLFIGNRANDSSPITVGGDSVFSDTIFTGNIAWLTGEGGGIHAGGNLTLLNCNVINNYGDHSTGGIYFRGSNLTISNCVINNNNASGRYGGIYAVGTNIVILNSSISGNYAFDNYGGITLYAYSNACLSGCTISSNRSVLFSLGAGGGVAAGGTLNMTNCTISGTSASYNPGVGVYCANNSTVQAVNCTVAYNAYGVQNAGTFYALNTVIAHNGTGPTNGDFSGTLTSQGYNLIGNLTNTTVVGSTNGNIYGLDSSWTFAKQRRTHSHVCADEGQPRD